MKHVLHVHAAICLAVALRRRAWIETLITPPKRIILQVALRRRAWIETRS